MAEKSNCETYQTEVEEKWMQEKKALNNLSAKIDKMTDKELEELFDISSKRQSNYEELIKPQVKISDVSSEN